MPEAAKILAQVRQRRATLKRYDNAVWAADPQVAKAPERLRARLLEAIRRCRLWVRADGMVVRMEQGSLEDFRDDKRRMAADDREVRLDPPLTTKDFEFRTPASIEVRDITDEVIRLRQQSER